MLKADHVAKSFGGVRALVDASVEVVPGRITGLIGKNGCGKSTLFNCMTGFIAPTSGQVYLDGRRVTGLPPQQLVQAGVSRTFQTPRVDSHITVREAVLCGAYSQGGRALWRHLVPTPGALADENLLVYKTNELLERFGLGGCGEKRIGTLSMGLVRLVEVARAMAAGARYLLLDEPAAGLTQQEQGVLATQIKVLANTGVGVLLVEHHFHLVRQLCDDVTVLDGGSNLTQGTPEEVAADPLVISSYLGVIGEKVVL